MGLLNEEIESSIAHLVEMEHLKLLFKIEESRFLDDEAREYLVKLLVHECREYLQNFGSEVEE
jgi:hypothetical protein